MWQGCQTITDYKGMQSRAAQWYTLIYFMLAVRQMALKHAWEHQLFQKTVWSCSPQLMWVRPLDRSTFTRPHGQSLPGCVLRACAELASVFTDIFNLSLTESVIPTCFKQTTISHVPKEVKVTCLNDYRPVALTSVAMKFFERLVMAHINSILLDTRALVLS